MSFTSNPHDDLAIAAQWLTDADGLLVAAGAGMGVDSGLPDFRGDAGFWCAYPALGQRGLAFHEIACPATFETDPRLAWGFYGHRLALYRNTRPHAGFSILRAVGARMGLGAFVFTSNVDGQFQQAGYPEERVAECHGSIHYLQCTRPCCDAVWRAASFHPQVDHARCRLDSSLPRCPHCGALARPNILMFHDNAWIAQRTEKQFERFKAWRASVKRLAVIEIGAGTNVPSVRRFSEAQGAPLIRVNPREPRVRRGVGLALNALPALLALAEEMNVDIPQETSIK